MNELVKEGFDLPVKNTKILFENKCVLVKHDDNTVPMACASSGVQSLTPLVLVSKYLSEFVQKEDNEGRLILSKRRADYEKAWLEANEKYKDLDHS